MAGTPGVRLCRALQTLCNPSVWLVHVGQCPSLKSTCKSEEHPNMSLIPEYVMSAELTFLIKVIKQLPMKLYGSVIPLQLLTFTYRFYI
jgi:hypothetical protein